MPEDQVRIEIPPVEKYARWGTLAQWKQQFTEPQIVEMLQRYCDAQMYAKAYRQRKAEKDRVMKQQLKDFAAKQGKTVEQLLAGEQAALDTDEPEK